MKFAQTLRIAFTLIMARTFGEYQNSGWTEFEYARYKWREQEWCIPLAPYEKITVTGISGHGDSNEKTRLTA